MKHFKFKIGIMIVMLVLINVAVGEEANEIYSYSIQLTYSNGDRLPTSPLMVSDLQKDLKIEVYNRLKVPDRFMLLCFLDGKLLPYVIDDVPYMNKSYEIDACGKININFSLDFDSSIIYKDSVVYIITVGLMDRIPRNAMDCLDLFSCGIPITINDPTYSMESSIANDENWHQISSEHIEPSDMYVYYPASRSDSTSEMGKSLVRSTIDKGYELNLAARGNDQNIAICLFVDNQPYPFDSAQPLTLFTSKDHLYLYTTNLQISEGIHSIYCVYMSLDSQKLGSWNTNKLSIVITNQ